MTNSAGRARGQDWAYQEITDKIVTELQAGRVLPGSALSKTATVASLGAPENAVAGRRYPEILRAGGLLGVHSRCGLPTRAVTYS